MTDILTHGRRYHGTFVPQTGQQAWYRNYKEPLESLDNGFGYKGVLLYNETQDKVLCAFCGEWYQTLRKHLGTHGLTATSYKQEYGLAKTTALVGERMRYDLIRQGVRMAQQNAKNKAWRLRHDGRKGQHVSQRTPEYLNVRGYCPSQLLVWMRQHPKATSQTDTAISAQIRKTFGSWAEARRKARLPVLRDDNATQQTAIEAIRGFVKVHHRVPYMSDVNRGLLPYSGSVYRRLFGSWSKAVHAAGHAPRLRHSGGMQFDYDTVEKWREMRSQGISIKAIAKMEGCHPQTVSFRLSGKRGALTHMMEKVHDLERQRDAVIERNKILAQLLSEAHKRHQSLTAVEIEADYSKRVMDGR